MRTSICTIKRSSRLTYFIVSLILALNFCIPALPVFANDTDQVSFLMQNGGQANGLTGFMENGVSANTQTYQSKESWVMQGKEADAQKTIYFTVGQEFRKEISDGTGVAITVEYFDSGDGFFSLVYDAVYDEVEDSEYAWGEKKTEPGKFAGFAELNNTNLWQTHTFYIRDPKFLKRLPNESDFTISLKNLYGGNCTDDVAIASVSVKKMDTKSPARIYSVTEEIGNIFFSDAQVKFSTDIISTVNYDFDGEIVFTAIDINDVGTMYDKPAEPMRLERDGTLDSKYILQQKREPFKLKAGENVNKTVVFEELERFGPMTYRVELIDEETGMYTVYDKAFSRVPRTEDEPLNQDLGMSMHYFKDSSKNTAFADTGLSLLNKAGISWIRGNAMWYQYEPKKDQYTIQSGTENFFKLNMEKYGGKFHMYPIMDGGNHLISPEYADYLNFENKTITDAFGDFVKNIAGMMKKYNVDTFEIINEPNLKTLNPRLYAGLLESINERAKTPMPEINIAGPATAEIPLASEDDYIPALFAEGGLDNLDIVAVHPYNWRYAPEFSGKTESLLKLRDLCIKYGKPDIEIWGTESGYPTSNSNPTLREVADDTGVIGQAAWMARFFTMTQAEKTLDKMFIYTLSDNNDRTNSENRFGITVGYESAYEPFIAKPALIVAANMGRMLEGAECTESIIEGDREILAYRFERPGKEQMAALWTTDQRNALTLSLGVNEITVYDMYGNPKTLTSKDGIYDFVLDGTVKYITGNFTDFTKTEPRITHSELELSGVVGDLYSYTLKNTTGVPLTIEADCGDTIELIDLPVFDENNTATGTFKLTKAVNSEITLSFYYDNQLYATASYRVVPVNTVDFALESCEPYNAKTLNRWAVTFTVTNNRAANPVSGSIKLSAPESVVSKLSPIPVEKIEPGRQRRITVYLPEMNRKYKDALSGTFYMDNGTEQFLSLEVDFTTAKYAQTAPTIDGVISPNEWMRGTWLYMDLASQIKQNDLWQGPSDLSGRSNLMWDEENLYLATVVTDNIFATPYTSLDRGWSNDSLQMAMKCDMTTEIYAFNELTISQNFGKTLVYRNKAEGNGTPGVVTNFIGEIKRDELAKTTTYELAIPWEELVQPGFEIKPEIQIAFSIMINENDGTTRRGWIELTPGIGLEKDPRLFTKISLIQ